MYVPTNIYSLSIALLSLLVVVSVVVAVLVARICRRYPPVSMSLFAQVKLGICELVGQDLTQRLHPPLRFDSTLGQKS